MPDVESSEYRILRLPYCRSSHIYEFLGIIRIFHSFFHWFNVLKLAKDTIEFFYNALYMFRKAHFQIRPTRPRGQPLPFHSRICGSFYIPGSVLA